MGKKRFFGCPVLFLALVTLWGCATTPTMPPGAPEKIEAPKLNIGDKWEFRAPDGYKWIDAVVNIEPDTYWMRVEGVGLMFDKNTMNVIKSPIPFWETHGKRLNFPLYVGKRWSYTTRKAPYGQTREVTYLNEFKVSRYEEVSTSAGKFNAYKIDYWQTNLDSGWGGKIEFWYSPEVKWFMKRRVGLGWPDTRWVQDYELVKFEITSK